MTGRDRTRQRTGFSWRFETALSLKFIDSDPDSTAGTWFDKSGRELGELFGVSKKTISNWRKNDVFPGVEQCFNICKILEVSIEWLLTGFGEPKPDKQWDPDVIWLVEMYSKLNADSKTKALNDMFSGYPADEVQTANVDEHQRILKLVTRDQMKK